MTTARASRAAAAGIFLLSFSVFVPGAKGSARKLGTVSDSGFGLDNSTSTWLIQATTSATTQASIQVTCPHLDKQPGNVCHTDGDAVDTYKYLVQVPFAPENATITFQGLQGVNVEDGTQFGIRACPAGNGRTSMQTSRAFCTPVVIAANPPITPASALTVDETLSPDGSTYTMVFGPDAASPGTSNFPNGGLTFFIIEVLPSGTTPTLPTVTVTGGAGLSLSAEWPGLYAPTGVGSDTSLLPTTLTFGSQTAGTTSPMQLMTLTNGGLSPLTVSSIAVSGDFAQVNTCLGAGPLAAGASCTLGVTFTPQVQGWRSGSLTIVDNAPSGTQSISLSGTGDGGSPLTFPCSTFTTNPACTNLPFGSWPVSTPAFSASASISQSVTVTNSSATNSVTITGLVFSNNPSTGLPDFILDPADTCTANSASGANVLAALANCNLIVDTQPNTLGPIIGTLTLTDQVQGTATPETHVFVLTLAGSSPVVSFDYPGSGPTLQFSNEDVGTPSPTPQTFPLNAGGNLIGMVSPAGFSHSACASSSCYVNMNFDPVFAGEQSGSLLVTSAVGNGAMEVAVSGIGNGPGVSLSTSGLAFGNQGAGTTSAAQAITVTNSGLSSLDISAISPTGAFAVDSATTTCSTSVALSAGATCKVGVKFHPTTTGPASGTLTLADNASPSSQTAVLAGTGVPGSAVLSPVSVGFLGQTLGVASAAKTVTLTAGNGNIVLTSIAASGDFIQTNNCPLSPMSLNSGTSCTINVTLKPLAMGPRKGLLVITDNAGNSPQKVFLTGVGAALSISPGSLAFPNEPVGTASAAQVIALANKAATPINLWQTAIGGPNAGDFLKTTNCSGTLAAGASCTVSVTFKPTAAGARKATVWVSNDGGGSPQSATLSGTGLAAAVRSPFAFARNLEAPRKSQPAAQR